MEQKHLLRRKYSATINELPNEVIVMIFDLFCTPKLLNMRLVSKHWKAVASSVCRRRSLEVKDDCSDLVKFLSTFKDAENFPCARISHYVPLSAQEEYFTLQKQFLRSYASHITHLTLYNDSKLHQILSSMTNLQELKINFFEHKSELPSADPIKLNFLQRVKLGNFSKEVHLQILEFLLKISTNRLQWLELETAFSCEEIARRLSPVLNTVPNVFLQISCGSRFELLEGFCVEKLLSVKKLAFHIKGIERATFCEKSKCFIQNLPNLEDLQFKCLANLEPFDIPAIPNLKTFKNELVYRNDWDFRRVSMTPRLHTFLSQLTSEHFPLLQKVGLTGCDEGCYTKGILRDCSFEHVTELELDALHHSENWMQVFPNLKKFKTRVEDCLAHVMQMTQLEHVEVHIDSTRNVSPFHPYGSRDLIKMKDLKVLVLKYKQNVFLGDFHMRPLLEIHPLQLLAFGNVKVSDHCKEELFYRHHHVVYK